LVAPLIKVSKFLKLDHYVVCCSIMLCVAPAQNRDIYTEGRLLGFANDFGVTVAMPCHLVYLVNSLNYYFDFVITVKTIWRS
jgi:hypothetical protein